MEIKANKKFWIMKDPEGLLYMTTAETTMKGCWERFCYPSLIKEGYQKAGWKPVRVALTEDKNTN